MQTPKVYHEHPIDGPVIEPDDSPDEVLDAAVEYTFPASDPIAIRSAYERRERSLERRRK